MVHTRLGKQRVALEPGLFRDGVLEQPVHDDHIGADQLTRVGHLALDKLAMVHNELQVEFGDRRAGTTGAARVVVDVALAAFEREVGGPEELDELVGRQVAGPVDKHRIALELVNRKRGAERGRDDADEIGQHVVSVLKLHPLEVAGVAADVGDQQIAPIDPCHSRLLLRAMFAYRASPPVRPQSGPHVAPAARRRSQCTP